MKRRSRDGLAAKGLFEAKLFTSIYTNRVVRVFEAFFYIVSFIHVKTNLHIFGHGLIVNSRCYGCCYVKKLLKFHTHLEENSARSFESVFDKCSRVLNLLF